MASLIEEQYKQQPEYSVPTQTVETQSIPESISHSLEQSFNPQEHIAQIIEQGKTIAETESNISHLAEPTQPETEKKPSMTETSHSWLVGLSEEQRIAVSMQFIYQKKKTIWEVIQAFLESGDYVGLDRLEETMNSEYGKLTEEGVLPAIKS